MSWLAETELPTAPKLSTGLTCNLIIFPPSAVEVTYVEDVPEGVVSQLD
jgi:hypothetical protein